MDNPLERSNAQLSQAGDKDAIIKELSRQRDWLMQELNHRVRNILQVVNSLLNTQLHYLRDDAAIEVTQESLRRIFTLSLVHTQLSPQGVVARVLMRWYIGELVEHLADSYDVRNEIRFEQQIDEIELDLSQALSVGLIVHEAVCNSIKYAFPIPGRDIIRIVLTHTDEHLTMLSVSDNGIGIPAPFFAPGTGHVGLLLIRGLAGDLNASFHLKNDKGAMINIEFKSTDYG